MWARASALGAGPSRCRTSGGARAHIELPGVKSPGKNLNFPKLGENIDQGDLVRLMVSLGASVTEGQPVMELETDKAVVEVPSSVSGTVNEIRVKEGEKVKVGQVIFTVENGSGAKPRPAEAQARKAPAAPVAPPPAKLPPAP